MGRSHTLAGLGGTRLAALALGAVAVLAAGTLTFQVSSRDNATTVKFIPAAFGQPESDDANSLATADDQPEGTTGMVIVFLRDGRRLEGRLLKGDPSKVVILSLIHI